MAIEGPTSRAQVKREQIRAGAQRMFLDRGFAASSTDAIAEEAQVSKRTLYAYYPSKEAIFDDVLRHLIDNGSPDWLPASGTSANNREELRQMLMGMAQKAIETLMQPDYLALVRVIIAETPRFPQLGSLFRSAVPEQNSERIIALLARARERGLVAIDDLDAAGRMFVGPLLTYVLLGGLFEGHGPPHRPAPERLESMVDLYLKAISGANADDPADGGQT